MFRKYIKLIKCIILLIALIIFTYFVKNYFRPFLLIIFLFFICNPIFNMLNSHVFENKKICGLISILLVNLILFIIIILLGNNMYLKYHDEYLSIYNNISQYIEIITNKFSVLSKNKLFDDSNFVGNFGIINSQIVKKGAIYTSESIFAYVIANISIYFIIIDKNEISIFIKNILNCDNLFVLRNKYKYISSLFRIELILVLITTIETIAGLWILNINNAVTIGIICGMLDVLPYIGTFIIFIPLILYNLYSKKYIIAIGLICLYLLLFISRQILEANFMSKKLSIHPLAIIISLYIGLKLFGLLGLLIGPIYVITAKEIIYNE